LSTSKCAGGLTDCTAGASGDGNAAGAGGEACAQAMFTATSAHSSMPNNFFMDVPRLEKPAS
jgi:hypothetical protein